MEQHITFVHIFRIQRKCKFYYLWRRHSALDGRAGEICPYLYFLSPSHRCAQWETGVAAALSCSATSTDLLLKNSTVLYLPTCYYALPPPQICCFRTALCYNCQLASMVCRLLRTIFRKVQHCKQKLHCALSAT